MCHLQRYKNENDQIKGIPKVDLIRHFNTIVNQGPATIIKNIQ